MEALFIISIAILAYTYLGYGFIAKCLTLFTKKEIFPVLADEDLPEITHIIAAYNEEDILGEKITNCSSLNYPASKVKTIIVTDGSTDRSSDIVKSDVRVINYHSDKRAGKLAAVNRVIKEVESGITVFSDANAILNNDALRNIAYHFQNNMVGAVAGEKVVKSTDADDATSSGEGLYWKYESWLKKVDYQLHSVVGAAGELFAIRTHLYECPKSNMLIEDFITSITVAKKGYRVAYAPDAIASESSSASIAEENKRKVRISAGGLQAVLHFKSLLNPFRYGILSFQYISHRVLRWTLAPLCLITALFSNFFLLSSGVAIYEILFILQILFYSLSVAGYYFNQQKIKIKIAFVPFYFSFMNLSIFMGLFRLLSGNYAVTWEKALRK
ncbi:MAG: biofilm PGA synthesis N-glycosyltransferase PgaC [Cyclobacteriaceae bacterium]|jgi:cellulose synthase/poly-beta-1,6-N-acetylglucosamine synthase-like glycosyltransferase